MSKTIYKEVTNVRWNAGVTLLHPTSGNTGGSVIDFLALLNNYYTKTQLITEGQSIVNFANVSEAYHNRLLGLEGGLSQSYESSGGAGEYYHLDYAYYQLLTDDVAGDKYLGTDSAGVKGWYDMPIGGDSFWYRESNDSINLISDQTGLYIKTGTIVVGDDSSGTCVISGHPSIYGVTAAGCELIIEAGQSTLGDTGGPLTLRGGTGMYAGGVVRIYGGTGNDSKGGDVYIYGGSGITRGNIYFGDDSNGYLPSADSSVTNVVMYDPDTGMLSYGTGGGTGDTYWTEDSDNFLTPIESDGIKIGDLHIFDGHIIQGNAESQNHLYISCEDALEGNYPGSVTIRAGSAHTNNPGYGGGSISLIPGNASTYNESDSDSFGGYIFLGSIDSTHKDIILQAANNTSGSSIDNASINIFSGLNGTVTIGSNGLFPSSESVSKVILSSLNGSIDIESYNLTFGWEGFLQSHDFYIGCYDNQNWDGANLHVKAGTTLGNDGLNGGSLYLEAGQGDEDGGHIYITAGRGENNDGGNVYIQTSWGDAVRGNIYFGDGAGNNTLPAASTGDDYVIRYNPTTGKLSYAAV